MIKFLIFILLCIICGCSADSNVVIITKEFHTVSDKKGLCVYTHRYKSLFQTAFEDSCNKYDVGEAIDKNKQ